KKLEGMAKVGIAAAKWFYPSHSREAQLAIAKFTALSVIVDDLGESILEALQNYRMRMLLRQPLGVKVIRSLFDSVLEIGKYFGRFETDMVFKATMEYLSASVVEIEARPLMTTPGFIGYFRLKTGISEAYALFIFQKDVLSKNNPHTHLSLIPDLMAFINNTNDIMSFYKESIVGNERDNCIHLHARANNQTIEEALMDFRRTTLNCLGKIREILTSNECLRKPVEEFIQGYLAFHFDTPRYRFGELALPSFV
ncbi:terpenoid synthase, partial [Acephala macrosclerotiorum]